MSRRERKRRKKAQSGGIRRKLFIIATVVGVCTVLGAMGVVGYIVGVAMSAPSIDSLKPTGKGASSIVYAANGERLGFIQSDELRTPVPAADIPETLKQATVAIEDERFYRHKGVDYEGIVRAALKNLRSGKAVEGGSTITMQLVRNLYISQERTFERKIREAKLAQELEEQHGKKWILVNYLNSVPYGTVGGQTAVGAQAAARIFFDKPAKDLKLHEAALLAGLPQAPSQYNPIQDPHTAQARRNEVLAKMAELGMVDAETATEAQRKPLGIRENSYYTTRREGYFFDYVKQQLLERYGANTVRRGGLRIYTTIDLKLQKAARAAISGQLNLPGDPSSAVVSIDPSNGYIKAMASSSRYGQSKFNLAAQGHRQPGSTFKTMVLMAALRRGVDPKSTSYESKPLDLKSSPYGPWKVSTYDDSYGGRMNLVKATLKSDNTVYAQLILDITPEAVRQTAYDMGIETKLDGYPAEGLGGLKLGVSPLEMSNAYATLASGGMRNKPIAITKVSFPGGRSEELGKPKRNRAFPDGVAYEATKILEQNVQSGTGTRAAIGCPAAGKTGTTDNFTDAWFAGYTPNLSTAVWVGYPNARIEMFNVHGTAVAGGTFPASIWHDYMAVAKRSDCSDFEQPTEPFAFKPFFGKYATTGLPDSDTDSDFKSEDEQTDDEKKEKDKKKQQKDGDKNGGGNTNNPAQYEKPAQKAPAVKKPPAVAPPVNNSPPAGGGGGNGGSNNQLTGGTGGAAAPG